MPTNNDAAVIDATFSFPASAGVMQNINTIANFNLIPQGAEDFIFTGFPPNPYPGDIGVG